MGLTDFTNNGGNGENNGSAGDGGQDIGTPGTGGPGIPIVIGIPGGPGGQQNSGKKPTGMEDIFINYNERFRLAQPIMFRDSVIRDTIGILIGKLKPNPLLVGPAGTGKTKIIEDIARRLANSDPLIPDELKGYTIYELPLASVVKGASYVGQLEDNVDKVIKFATDPKNKAILFIDEIHQLVNGDQQIYGKIAQWLKPALGRGNVRVIGATTTQEVTNFFHDPAFQRRFSRVLVNELSKEETAQIVRMSVPRYITSRVTISDEVCEKIVADADDYRYMNNHRPDNALTLLDRSVSHKVMQMKETELSLGSDPAQLKVFKQIPSFALTENDVRKTAIRLLMGGVEKPSIDSSGLREAFSVIKGQEKAVDAVIEEVERREKAIFPLTKPSTFLFSGSSGVGKTEIANILARYVTGMKPIKLNMTEYTDSASVNRIIGVPMGYVGCDSAQELPFDILDTNPYQVILLDEFEKGDRSVQRLFMSVFDEGTLSTNIGKTIDFSKAIIIATTNAGCTNARSAKVGITHEEVEEDITNLEDSFDIELINRFKSKVKFNSIDKATYKDIMANIYRRMIADVKQRIRRISLPDELDDDVLDEMVEKSYNSKLGARPAENHIRRYIENNA